MKERFGGWLWAWQIFVSESLERDGDGRLGL